ncbi:MAG TPA: DUF4282 domain-containing protein [Puia sp.]|nr:DUF4282 domain-containing protein [Puia sp.]
METPNQHEPTKFKFDFKEFISFRQMIALKIIQILYVVVAILITLFALVTMFKGGGGDYGYGSVMPGGFLSGLFILIFGNLGWRIYCELMIVLFRMNKSLTEIEHNTKKPDL